jgi:hypothetical protein
MATAASMAVMRGIETPFDMSLALNTWPVYLPSGQR